MFLCSLVFFLTSISFIRYKVTVMVLICFVFPSWITNEILKYRYIYHRNDLITMQWTTSSTKLHSCTRIYLSIWRCSLQYSGRDHVFIGQLSYFYSSFCGFFRHKNTLLGRFLEAFPSNHIFYFLFFHFERNL